MALLVYSITPFARLQWRLRCTSARWWLNTAVVIVNEIESASANSQYRNAFTRLEQKYSITTAPVILANAGIQLYINPRPMHKKNNLYMFHRAALRPLLSKATAQDFKQVSASALDVGENTFTQFLLQ